MFEDKNIFANCNNKKNLLVLLVLKLEHDIVLMVITLVQFGYNFMCRNDHVLLMHDLKLQKLQLN